MVSSSKPIKEVKTKGMTTEQAEKIAQELEEYQARMDKKQRDEQIRMEWFKSLYHATNGSVRLPYDATSMVFATVYKPHPEVWDAEKEKMVTDYAAPQEVDVNATNIVLAKVTQHASALGYPVNKNYSDKYYTHEVILQEDPESKYNNVTVSYEVNRESVCRKVVTGTKHVEEKIIPAHDEEVVEWECEKISFLGMDTTDGSDSE